MGSCACFRGRKDHGWRVDFKCGSQREREARREQTRRGLVRRLRLKRSALLHTCARPHMRLSGTGTVRELLAASPALHLGLPSHALPFGGWCHHHSVVVIVIVAGIASLSSSSSFLAPSFSTSTSSSYPLHPHPSHHPSHPSHRHHHPWHHTRSIIFPQNKGKGGMREPAEGGRFRILGARRST